MNSWFEPLHLEFQNGTDRSYAIVAASMIDVLLSELLVKHLVPIVGKDILVNGHSAPLGSFNARINACYSLGFITDKFRRDLTLIREIRNKFAHSFEDVNFESSSVGDRIEELSKSIGLLERCPNLRKKSGLSKGNKFFLATSSIAAFLSAYVQDDVSPFKEEKELEWPYTTRLFEDEPDGAV